MTICPYAYMLISTEGNMGKWRYGKMAIWESGDIAIWYTQFDPPHALFPPLQLTSSFALSPTIITSLGSNPHIEQMWRRGAGLGLYGRNSRLNAGENTSIWNWREGWISVHVFTCEYFVHHLTMFVPMFVQLGYVKCKVLDAHTNNCECVDINVCPF